MTIRTIILAFVLLLTSANFSYAAINTEELEQLQAKLSRTGNASISAKQYLKNKFVKAQSITTSSNGDSFANPIAELSVDATNTTASFQSQLDNGGDLDFFRLVVGDNGGELTIQTTGSTDTFGSVGDQSGALGFDTNDDSGTGLNFLINETLSPGTYIIIVEGFDSSETGSYTLDVSLTPGPDDDDPRRFRGNSIPATLENSADADVYTFRLRRPSMIVLETTGSTNTKGILFDSDGNAVSGNNNFGNFRIAGNIGRGAYSLLVAGSSGASGPYTVTRSVSRARNDARLDGDSVSSPARGRRRSLVHRRVGSTRSIAAVLDSSIFLGERNVVASPDVDVFRIVLRDAGLFTVNTTGELDTVGALLDANGNTIDTNDDGGEGLNFSISENLSPGTYFISIEGFSSSELGEYTLNSTLSSVLVTQE